MFMSTTHTQDPCIPNILPTHPPNRRKTHNQAITTHISELALCWHPKPISSPPSAFLDHVGHPGPHPSGGEALAHDAVGHPRIGVLPASERARQG